MKLMEETKDGVLVLSPEGHLDNGVTAAIEQAVKMHDLRPHGAARVVMNCAGLTLPQCGGDAWPPDARGVRGRDDGPPGAL